jgi:hypothetical protein
MFTILIHIFINKTVVVVFYYINIWINIVKYNGIPLSSHFMYLNFASILA